jgi:hypothetical protein
MAHIDKLMDIVNIISKHKGLINSADVDDIKGVSSLVIGKFEEFIQASRCFAEIQESQIFPDMMYTTETNEVYVFV